MAQKVSELQALATGDLVAGDLFLVVDIGAGVLGSKKITAGDLADALDRLQKSAGWAAATGTATRTTFATTTVTTEQLAERVKALIDDLVAQGRLGP